MYNDRSHIKGFFQQNAQNGRSKLSGVVHTILVFCMDCCYYVLERPVSKAQQRVAANSAECGKLHCRSVGTFQLVIAPKVWSNEQTVSQPRYCPFTWLRASKRRCVYCTALPQTALCVRSSAAQSTKSRRPLFDAVICHYRRISRRLSIG